MALPVSAVVDNTNNDEAHASAITLQQQQQQQQQPSFCPVRLDLAGGGPIVHFVMVPSFSPSVVAADDEKRLFVCLRLWIPEARMFAFVGLNSSLFREILLAAMREAASGKTSMNDEDEEEDEQEQEETERGLSLLQSVRRCSTRHHQGQQTVRRVYQEVKTGNTKMDYVMSAPRLKSTDATSSSLVTREAITSKDSKWRAVDLKNVNTLRQLAGTLLSVVPRQKKKGDGGASGEGVYLALLRCNNDVEDSMSMMMHHFTLEPLNDALPASSVAASVNKVRAYTIPGCRSLAMHGVLSRTK